ncbi:hypothetical protein [Actinomadura sp. NEAU-AAG7]|uniref:hypothetical protein n=1 Tax=Actinomadura sp. NEAU-AAG7 TaxID=2839640 RepID=UPI001BE40304|nr:hypothetical protein [Actinomadura sp. NEAU-AAG7]MBT2213473.1 hypothetical protein [Actinomadura sp. NEAU-AAG7]
MPTHADPHQRERLQWDIEELIRPGGLIDQIEELMPKQTATADTNKCHRGHLFGPPIPWHAEAAAVLMDIHVGARDLENLIRYQINGTTRNRGGSDGNTRLAIREIGRLSYALPAAQVEDAAAMVRRWVTAARQIGDIDQADRWVPLPRQPGHYPPPCPYCDTYALRMSRRAGEVRCINPECADARGRRPVARMAHGLLSGDAYLAFADGREVTYQ